MASDRLWNADVQYHPLLFEVRLSNPAADLVARTFIRCPVDGAASAGIYDPIAARLRKDPRWRVVELASNHLAPLVAPDAVAGALVAISHQLPMAARRSAT